LHGKPVCLISSLPVLFQASTFDLSLPGLFNGVLAAPTATVQRAARSIRFAPVLLRVTWRSDSAAIRSHRPGNQAWSNKMEFEK
jgi:hypothetical protein